METRLAALFRRLEAGDDARMTVPASEEDLRRLDNELGETVPLPLRALLRRVGGGLFAHGHEIFGASRVMIHDIELVPDLLTVRAQLAAEGRLGPHLIPFHRTGSAIHLMRSDGAVPGQVVSMPPGEAYADLASFLDQVMLRPAPQTPPRGESFAPLGPRQDSGTRAMAGAPRPATPDPEKET